MKKIFCFILFMTVFPLAQAAFGDVIPTTITLTDEPQIPIIKGKASGQLLSAPIAGFSYTDALKGEISSASVEGNWGAKNIGGISKLSLYLDDKLLIDFNQYYKGLNKTEKRLLRTSLRSGEMIPIDVQMDQADIANLEGGQAQLYLVGKPRLFRKLNLAPLTLRIVDLVPNNPLGTQTGDGQTGYIEHEPNPLPVPPTEPEGVTPGVTDPTAVAPQASPEPVSILLLGTGLVGLAGYMRKKLF